MWKTFESSVQGRSHFKENIPCQDKTCCLTVGDVTTIALADGAGSAKLSQFGAECAVRTISEELCNKFESYWEEKDVSVAKFRFFQEILGKLEQRSQELSCNMRDLASTLLAVSVKGNRFIIFHLGDGVIGYKEGLVLKVASAPYNGEFSNTTVFTTSPDAELQTKLIKASSNTIDGIILMSDGPEACLYDHRNNTLATGIVEMLNDAAKSPIEDVNANINETMHETIAKKTFDDCSIVIMAKTNKAVKEDDRTSRQNFTKELEEKSSLGVTNNLKKQSPDKEHNYNNKSKAKDYKKLGKGINEQYEQQKPPHNYLLGSILLVTILILLLILILNGTN